MAPAVMGLSRDALRFVTRGTCNDPGRAPGPHSTGEFHAQPTTSLAAVAIAASGALTAGAADSADASFVFLAVTRGSNDYHAATGHEVIHPSIGSGGGIAQIKAGTVDFGSSDKPLPPKDLLARAWCSFPR
ncbi:hypothetical protein GCM10023332_18220 [Luteimonas vadosa]|uniref:PBP domain-containing protein n=1 Tax=Luteimonas vadosa TaxID=1165507 RepID=A0ABP9E7A0_9GAMM